ncbi:MAG: hypothetical protein LBT48_08375 [Prevotellaceae bacterium]|jgi:hypothetical protein|nr:hypothetical protein [Prevotellaceae bacterium]
MKAKILFYMSALLFAGAGFFAACEDDEKPINGGGDLFDLDIEGDTLYISGAKDAETLINFDSDYDWEVSEKPEWLFVDPDGDSKGIVELVFTATPLEGKSDVDERYGVLTLKALNADRSITVTVKQSYDFPSNHTCRVTPNAITAPVSASETTFKVICNAPWTLVAENDWITLDKTSGGASSSSITVRATIAASTNERTGKIILKSGNKSATVTVQQKIVALEGKMTAKTLSAPASGSADRRTKKFYLQINYPWTFEAGEGNESWIHVSPTTGSGSGELETITALIDEGGPREGKILLKVHMSKSEDGEIVNYDDVREIAVRQIDDASGYWKDDETIYLHASHDLPAGHNPIPIAFVMDGFDLGDLKKMSGNPNVTLNGQKIVQNPAAVNAFQDNITNWNTVNDCLYERYVRALADLLLRLPVVRDFERYFDIRAYVAESNSRGKYEFTPFGWSWRGGRNDGKMYEKGFAMFGSSFPKINDIKPDGSGSNVTYLFGSNAAVGGFNNGDNCTISTPLGEPRYYYHLGHEYIGHTLGRIGDLYRQSMLVIDNVKPNSAVSMDIAHGPASGDDYPGKGMYYTNDQGWEADSITPLYLRPVRGYFRPCYKSQSADNNFNDCNVRNMVVNFSREWVKGGDWCLDYESDPSKTIWRQFLEFPEYATANLGAYITGYIVFDGFYRPEQAECMDQSGESHYGLGTRIWLWNRILERAGLPDPTNFGDWNEHTIVRNISAFKAWDIAPRTDLRGDITNASNGYAGRPTYVYQQDSVLTGKYWTDHDFVPERGNKDGGGL